jgi:hypothetical protein
MSDITIVKNLLDDEDFLLLQSFVLDSLRHIGEYDAQFNRSSVHESPALFDLHKRLTPFASDLFGVSLKPSYNYVSSYYDGGRCPLHFDRDQCFRTIDLLVYQENSDPWSLMISDAWRKEDWDKFRSNIDIDSVDNKLLDLSDVDANWNEVLLYPNDAACYSGTDSWHYRPEPSTGRADLIFFHFVEEDFDGQLS